jgi:hypothetical protein
MQRAQMIFAVIALFASSCSQQFDLGIKPVDVPTPSIEYDEYSVQVTDRKVDLLFVIDNSGSMREEIVTVQNSFSSFISSFVGRGLDYNIAVTTTDLARANSCTEFNCYRQANAYLSDVLQGIGLRNFGPGSLLSFHNSQLSPPVSRAKVLSSSSMQAAVIVDSFKDNVAVGTDGSPGEAGLAAAIEATKTAMLTGFNQGFVRPEARLNVILLSDEDESFGYIDRECPFEIAGSGAGVPNCDYSDYLANDAAGQAATSRINEFRAHMDLLKDASRPDLFRLDVISGDPDFVGSCSANSRGRTLKQAVQSYGSTRGQFIDLCQGDFAPALASLGSDLSGQIERRFKLKHRPANPNELRVFIDDTEIQKSLANSDGFTYTPSLNASGIDVGGTVEIIGLNLESRRSFTARIFYERAR